MTCYKPTDDGQQRLKEVPDCLQQESDADCLMRVMLIQLNKNALRPVFIRDLFQNVVINYTTVDFINLSQKTVFKMKLTISVLCQFFNSLDLTFLSLLFLHCDVLMFYSDSFH